MNFHWESVDTPSGRKYNYLLIYCEDRAYQYSPTHPTLHLRYRDRLWPNSLVAGLVFLTDYQKKHPTEKISLIFPDAPKNSTNAVALYTQNCQTYYYDYTIGSFSLPSITPEDWSNPAKRGDIITAARQVHKTEHDKGLAVRQDITPEKLKAEQDDDKSLETLSVYKTFQQAGIPCQLITERDLGEDGHWHEYAVPTLIFQWQGVSYTYNDFHACVRTAGHFPARIRIE